MSEHALTREQLLTMFGVQHGTRLSKYPFEIPAEMVQRIIDTDAALRDELDALNEQLIHAQERLVATEVRQNLALNHAADLTRQLAAAREHFGEALD